MNHNSLRCLGNNFFHILLLTDMVNCLTDKKDNFRALGFSVPRLACLTNEINSPLGDWMDDKGISLTGELGVGVVIIGSQICKVKSGRVVVRG